MAEKMSEVYGAYDIDIHQTMRGRGATILKTDKGIFQLKQLDVNPSRLMAEYELKEMLSVLGFDSIDRCIKNRDEELYTCDRYGNPFVLRKYFLGRECNPINGTEILLAVRNLARFHQVGKAAFENSERDVHIRLTGDFKKRNQGLKRVKNYITKQKSKREFEGKFLKTFDYFYNQGKKCQEDFVSMAKQEEEGLKTVHLGYCHGMYNHHSLIMAGDEVGRIGTVGFDRFYLGNQLDDLYHFVRKTVEKNNYNFQILKMIIEEYSNINPLSKEDLQYIYINYCYPEKYYKLGNQYINSTKNWLSPKMLEKIDKYIDDEGKKQLLLDKMKKMYVVASQF